ncbi:MAG: hypothetical protein EAZ42_10890 [Verrucomicrobia bacterium]|nr:MAG: hypothetical protein EAZ42_10890 [Verrucomicrobiota bacterium]
MIFQSLKRQPERYLGRWIGGCFLISMLSMSAQVPVAGGGPVEVNAIAAKVNGKVITRNEVSFLLAPRYAQLVTRYPRRGARFDAEFKEAKDAVLQELVDREIILSEFKELGASIKPFLIEEEIKRQMQELYNGDEAKFREELKKSRLTMDGYREMTKEKMIVQAMRSQQFKDVPPPLPGEIQTEYQKVKSDLRDMSKDVIDFQKIFIPASDAENPLSIPETQLALAEDIVRQINEGKSFDDLAKQYSKDAFAEAGGIQRGVPRTDLSPEFAAILFDTPVGTVAGPLLDPQGFTIIKPLKIIEGPAPGFDDKMREMLEERVRRKKTSAQYDRWIEGKRKRAMVEMRP